MKCIIVSVATGKQVAAVDICGVEHWEPIPRISAMKTVTIMNAEAGEKLYRVEPL